MSITAWSYSRWDTYRTCPLRAKFLYVDKLAEPKGPAMDRGIKIHKEIEKYLREGGRQPACIAPMKEKYRELRKLKPLVEKEVAFDVNWNQVGWFDKAAWCRVKVDALVQPDDVRTTVFVIDHKSGKISEGKYDDQVELYGLTGLILTPQAATAAGELWFLEHNKIYPEVPVLYLQKDLKLLKKKWVANVKGMLTDTRFEPRPGNYCRWCHFRKSNGGPCQY